MKKHVIAIGVLMNTLLLCFSSYAQQDPQYTQYMFNTMSVNPGYAGSRDVLTINLLHRSQWMGLNGAPSTQTLGIDSPLNSSGSLAGGINIVNDKIGPVKETYFDTNLSYTMATSPLGKLSFGLKLGVHLLDVDILGLKKFGTGETIENIENKLSPTLGAGLYYRHNEKWYVGLSVPNFLGTKHFSSGSQVSIAKERIHFYGIAGYVFDINNNIKFKPAILTKVVSGAPLQIDGSGSFLFNEKFILGGAYRSSKAMSGFVGVHVNSNFLFGLAYDKDLTDLGNTKFNSGSFEAFLRFNFLKTPGKILHPRFF